MHTTGLVKYRKSKESRTLLYSSDRNLKRHPLPPRHPALQPLGAWRVIGKHCNTRCCDKGSTPTQDTLSVPRASRSLFQHAYAKPQTLHPHSQRMSRYTATTLPESGLAVPPGDRDTLAITSLSEGNSSAQHSTLL